MMNLKNKYFLAFFVLFFSLGAESQILDTLKEVTILERRVLTPSKSFTTITYDSLILAKYEFSEISEVLSDQAGFYIKNTGPNGLATLSVRGLSASQTKIFWNGISITPPTLGLSDLSLIPTFFYDQVNVNVGGASLINGTGALGGSVNLINKNFLHDGPKIMFGVKYNPELNSRENILSHQWKRKRFSIQTKLLHQVAENNFSYREQTLLGDVFERRENADLKRYGISQNYYYKIRKSQEISFNTIYLLNDKNVPAPIRSANNRQNQIDKIFRNHLGWIYSTKKAFHKVGVAYLLENSRYQDPIAFIDSEFEVETISSYYHFGYSLTPKLSLGLKVNNDNHQVKSSGFQDNVHQNRSSFLSTLSYENKSRWGAIASVRNELIGSETHDISPSIGIFIQPLNNKKYKLKSNLSKNIRTPALNDLYWEIGGNVDLLDEDALSGEVAVEYNSDNINMDVTYFNSITENWIQWIPKSNNVWQPMNIKKVKSDGIEFGIKYESDKKSSIKKTMGINYRHSKTYNAEVNEENNQLGKELIFTPRNQVSINLALRMKKWVVGYSQKITSKVFIDASNETYLPYYAPASVSVLYTPIDRKSEKLNFELVFNNIFDEEYQVVTNQPIPMRNISIMMRLNF